MIQIKGGFSDFFSQFFYQKLGDKKAVDDIVKVLRTKRKKILCH